MLSPIRFNEQWWNVIQYLSWGKPVGPFLLWVRREECERESNSAVIQLIQGFWWVTEPWVTLHVHREAGAGKIHLSEGNNISCEVCTGGSRKTDLIMTWERYRSLWQCVHLKHMSIYLTWGRQKGHFHILSMDPCDNKQQDPNAKKRNIFYNIHLRY